MCGGCGRPRHESFAPESERHYDAHVLKCHACAKRERLAHSRAEERRETNGAPAAGEYIIVTYDDDPEDDWQEEG